MGLRTIEMANENPKPLKAAMTEVEVDGATTSFEISAMCDVSA